MKTILLTGATDGIGFETAKLLAQQGHTLLLHGRSDEKLALTVQKLKQLAPATDIQIYRADLARFDDIDALVQAILRDHSRLDVIINNAGVFKTAQPTTADGLDSRFMVNTFAPYIIATLLLPILAADGRVVNLSSAAQAPVDIGAMRGEYPITDAFQAYAQSKLALTIWSQEVAKTLLPDQVMVAVNPGSLLASKMVTEGFGVAGNDLAIGSSILLKAVLGDEFSRASGLYFDNDSGQFSMAHAEVRQPDKCARVMATIADVTGCRISGTKKPTLLVGLVGCGSPDVCEE